MPIGVILLPLFVEVILTFGLLFSTAFARTRDLRTKNVSETPYATILGDLHAAVTNDRPVVATDPLTGQESIYAAAKVPTGGWTLVMQTPRSDLVGLVQPTDVDERHEGIRRGAPAPYRAPMPGVTGKSWPGSKSDWWQRRP